MLHIILLYSTIVLFYHLLWYYGLCVFFAPEKCPVQLVRKYRYSLFIEQLSVNFPEEFENHLQVEQH